MKHIFLKTSDQINIINKTNNIVILPEILASIVIDKKNAKRISINFNGISIKNDNYIHKIDKTELYFRESVEDNLQYFLKIEEINYFPAFINTNSIRNLLINGKIMNHKNINLNNFHNWLSNEGGIDIEDFKLNTNNIPIKGNAFLGIDENLDIQSSISIESEKFDDLALFLRDKNLVSEDLFKSLIIIIKAIELGAKTSNKIPKYSIGIQEGYLSLMGVKLLNIPRFNRLNLN